MRETQQPSGRRTPPAATPSQDVTFLADELWKVLDPKGHMTLRDKARHLGVPLSTLSLVTNGHREPNAAFIAAVRRSAPARHRIERFFRFGKAQTAPLDEAA